MLSTSEHGSAKLASIALKQFVGVLHERFYWQPTRSFTIVQEDAIIWNDAMLRSGMRAGHPQEAALHF